MRINLLILFLSVSIYASGQTSWTSINSDFPGNDRYGSVGFSINGIGYIGAGFPNFSYTQKDFYSFDPTTNTWTRIADYGGQNFTYGFAAVVNNLAYVGLGSSDWYVYDPLTNVWTQRASFPHHIDAVAGFVIGDNIYVATGLGGSGTGYGKEVWMYNTQYDTWTRKADFAGTGRYAAVGFAINGKGYVGSGTDGWISLSDFWEYDPAKDSWKRKADYPGGGKYFGATFTIGNIGYFGMGLNENDDPSSGFYGYDPSTNSWMPAASCPIATFEGATFVIDHVGYYGTNTFGSSEFYKFSAPTVTPPPPTLPKSIYKVYPNPTNGELSLEIGATALPMHTSIRMVNTLGQLVLQQPCTTTEIQHLSLESFPVGMYELILLDEANGYVLFKDKIILYR